MRGDTGLSVSLTRVVGHEGGQGVISEGRHLHVTTGIRVQVESFQGWRVTGGVVWTVVRCRTLWVGVPVLLCLTGFRLFRFLSGGWDLD